MCETLQQWICINIGLYFKMCNLECDNCLGFQISSRGVQFDNHQTRLSLFQKIEWSEFLEEIGRKTFLIYWKNSQVYTS